MRIEEIGLWEAIELRVTPLSGEMELAGALERLRISEPAASPGDARGLRPLIFFGAPEAAHGDEAG